MTLAEVGRRGQRVDVINGGDVAPDGRLLSIAEIQAALRTATPNVTSAWDALDVSSLEQTVAHPGEVGVRAGIRIETLQTGWICVVAAHSGAGSTTVAVSLADAAGTAGRDVTLIDPAEPARSGLTGAADTELGIDRDGVWRRGRRGRVTIVRRATDRSLSGWPGNIDPAAMVILDLGLPPTSTMSRLTACPNTLIVVCSPTIPGMRAAETLLAALHNRRVIVVAVGAGKWPRELSASLGPRIGAVVTSGRIVRVPRDRRLQRDGVTSAGLPKSLSTVGRRLLRDIDALAGAAELAGCARTGIGG